MDPEHGYRTARFFPLQTGLFRPLKCYCLRRCGERGERRRRILQVEYLRISVAGPIHCLERGIGLQHMLLRFDVVILHHGRRNAQPALHQRRKADAAPPEEHSLP